MRRPVVDCSLSLTRPVAVTSLDIDIGAGESRLRSAKYFSFFLLSPLGRMGAPRLPFPTFSKVAIVSTVGCHGSKRLEIASDRERRPRLVAPGMHRYKSFTLESTIASNLIGNSWLDC